MQQVVSPATVAENDLRKLHSEVNQIVSQRFTLITIAVLVFAAICGWATSAKPVTPEFVALVSFLLLIILGALFSYFMLLLGMMRIFTVYIIQKYDSPWEKDWEEYRESTYYRGYGSTYWGYTKPGSTMFQLLGVLAIAFPLALFFIAGEGHNWSILLVPIVLFFFYEIIVYWVTDNRKKINQ